jgi:hypothetical protein
VAVCVMPTPAPTSENRKRRQQIRRELVKAPLRFQYSFRSSLCEREEPGTKTGQVVGASSGAVLYL